MELSDMVWGFLEAVQSDPRIAPSHISLFIVIVYNYYRQGCNSPVSVYRKDLMRQSKISSSTYIKCISELKEYGYIDYIPSYNPVLGSLIYLKKL